MRSVGVLAVAAILLGSAPSTHSQILEEADWDSGSIPSSWKISVSDLAQVPKLTSGPSCSGNRAVKFDVTFKNDRSGFRNELALVGPYKDFNFGEDRWLGWAIYLPQDYPIDKWGETLMQFHGVPDRGSNGQLLEPYRHPMIALKTESDGTWKFNIKGNSKKISSSIGDSTRQRSYDLGTFEGDRGRWVEFVMNIRFDHTANGRIQLWKDGKKMFDDRGENSYNDDVPPYLKIGIYKPAWKTFNWGGSSYVNSRTIYYDSIKLARHASIGEVAPNCGNSGTAGGSSSAAPRAPYLMAG